NGGQGREVGGEGVGRQSALADDDGVHELPRHVLCVGTRAAGAEDYELASLVEPDGHGVARRGDRVSLAGQLAGGPDAALERPLGIPAGPGQPRGRILLVAAHPAAPAPSAGCDRSTSTATSRVSRTRSAPRNPL